MSRSKNWKRESSDHDLALALELHQQCNSVGLTENAVFPDHKNKENYQPRTLIDQTLEILDPTPNIYTLFMQFNARFFSNKLVSVEVKWSKRMTSCAGVCSFHPRSRDCVISLSAPLLKLRPRKDLVETLLHEMIHGYLFLTNNNRDRDGHGPEFCKHMNRINKEAGTHISIYHSFHDEVKLYQQHWWRCNGPCQNQHPYFGTVRRAMNRAPGPSDFWWKTHQQNCGGQFIKVKEPDKTKEKSKSQKITNEKKKSNVPSKTKNDKNLEDFFAKPKTNSNPALPVVNSTSSSIFGVAGKSNGVDRSTNNPSNGGNNYNPRQSVPTSTRATSTPKAARNPSSNGGNNYNPRQIVATSAPKAVPAGLVKLGTATNNVHGWGTGGPNSASGKSPNIPKNNFSNTVENSKRTLNFAGTVGGTSTGRSNLLDKFSAPVSTSIASQPLKKLGSTIILDSPPKKKPKISSFTENFAKTVIIDFPDLSESHDCPICGESMPQDRLNDHLDSCLVDGPKNGEKSSSIVRTSKNVKISDVIEITSSPETSQQSRRPGESKMSPQQRGQTNLNDYVTSPKKTSAKRVSCPVCGKFFEMDLLNEHLDDCLSRQSDDDVAVPKNATKRREIAAGSSGQTKLRDHVDLTDEKINFKDFYVCLVCNSRINGDIALNDHLEECVHGLFNDDSIDGEFNDSLKSSSTEASTTGDGNKFPCPICMQMIAEKNMNEHLDTCLSGEKWD